MCVQRDHVIELESTISRILQFNTEVISFSYMKIENAKSSFCCLLLFCRLLKNQKDQLVYDFAPRAKFAKLSGFIVSTSCKKTCVALTFFFSFIMTKELMASIHKILALES